MIIPKQLIPKKYRTSEKEIEKRLSICSECRHNVKSTNSCGTLLLGKDVMHEKKWVHLCGCITSEKAIFKNLHCDLDKW